MAISRREIIRLGVSYGTGAINFGNDSVAYERALRKLPADTHLAEFLEELDRATEVLAAEEAAAEAEAEATAEAAAEAAECETADENAVPAPEDTDAPIEDAAVESSAETTTGEADAAPEAQAPRENPLVDAIEKAFAFRSFCASLALSELFIQTTALINTMQTACLPAVDDIEKLKHDYNAIIDYLKHC